MLTGGKNSLRRPVFIYKCLFLFVIVGFVVAACRPLVARLSADQGLEVGFLIGFERCVEGVLEVFGGVGVFEWWRAGVWLGVGEVRGGFREGFPSGCRRCCVEPLSCRPFLSFARRFSKGF